MNGCESCNVKKKTSLPPGKVDFTVALAGNANVGKSTIFNQLTGVDQVVGNWPGKTVERAEGILQYKGKKIKIVDLPGIYSFSTFSMEELVSRDFIALEKPDVVVNVVDATQLERNLYLTLQLLELEVPTIIALNQTDLLKKRGIKLDPEKLSRELGVPVIETSAKTGRGLTQLSDAIISPKKKSKQIKYGAEVEAGIRRIEEAIPQNKTDYPTRFSAIKLIEKDSIIKKKLPKKACDEAGKVIKQLEKMHGHDSGLLMTSERYAVADSISKKIQKINKNVIDWSEKTDNIFLHPWLGYLFILIIIGGLLYWTFAIGFWLSGLISGWLSGIESLNPLVSGSALAILWNGAFSGFVAGATLVIPYVLPFYLLLAVLEDSGYLTRISFLLDRGMHKLGLHGKAIIPLIMGYGCSVPACFSCRIMETEKQKLISSFLVTLIPCTARTVVILGLVAAFVNIWWALGLFAFDILLIILMGRIAYKTIPGESVGLIMEMPKYHLPSIKVVLKQTWVRTKSLILIVLPTYIIASAGLQLAYAWGWLDPINKVLTPITVSWLMLPAITGVLLIFGVVRKEYAILMLAVLLGTTDFNTVLTQIQLITLALVTMLYIPCLSTILALGKEFGWKKALGITAIEIFVAIVMAGIASRILPLFF
jgi:ferrous iron transport protein B